MNKHKKDDLDSSEVTSHTMGLRLNDRLYQQLEQLSQELNLKKSQLLKQAFKMYAIQRESIQRENMIVFDKFTIKLLLAELTPEKIREIAKQSADRLVGTIRMRFIEADEKLSLEKFTKRNKRMLTQGAFGWFDNLSHKLSSENVLQIYGMHSLNKNFSLFVEELLNAIIFELFKYKLDTDRSETRNNMINLYYSKEIKN